MPGFTDVAPREGEECHFRNQEGIWVRGVVVQWDPAIRRGLCAERHRGGGAEDGQPVSVGATEVRARSDEGEEQGLSGCELHPAAVLDALVAQYRDGLTCGYLGEVLVSVNPAQVQSRARHPFSLCNPGDVAGYVAQRYAAARGADDAAPHADAPHVWDLAWLATRLLRETKRSQTVVPFGLSQGGQTEAAKSISRFIVREHSCFAASADDDDGGGDGRMRDARGEVLGAVGLVLEAFGCARESEAAPNSSRHHRVTRHRFDRETGRFLFSQVHVHLLETQRVSLRPAGDGQQRQDRRSFHSFYLLLHSAERRARYRLDGGGGGDDGSGDGPHTPFGSLSNGVFHNRDFSSAEELEEVEAAMEDALGLGVEGAEALWAALAGLLHLQRAGGPDFAAAGECLGIDAGSLQVAFSAGGMVDPAGRTEAINTPKVDFFCRSLYGAVHARLVEAANYALVQACVEATGIDAATLDALPQSHIDVVDYSGLGTSPRGDEVHSVGALRLNTAYEVFCKELFTERFIKGHVERCYKEGVILATPGVHVDGNVSMLTNGAVGIVQVAAQATNAVNAVRTMRRQYYGAVPSSAAAEAPAFVTDDEVLADSSAQQAAFSVKHFVEPHYTKYVVHDSDCHLADGLDFELIRLSSNPALAALPPPEMAASFEAFKRELAAMREAYFSSASSIHYAMCLSPSPSAAAPEVDQTYVGQQLFSSMNAAAVLQIQRHGYPVHLLLREFASFFAPIHRYPRRRAHEDLDGLRGSSPGRVAGSMVFAPYERSSSPSALAPVLGDERVLCEQILGTAGVGTPYDARLGTSSVFLMSHAHKRLVAHKMRAEVAAAEAVQAWCRAHAARTATLAERVREAIAPQIEAAKAAIRAERRLARALADVEAEETAARAGVEEDLVWALLDVAGDFGLAFFDVYLSETESREEESRGWAEAAQAHEWLQLFNVHTACELTFLVKAEEAARWQILEDEDARIREAYEEELRPRVEAWHVRGTEEDEEAMRAFLDSQEAHERATLEAAFFGAAAGITEREELGPRTECIVEEREEWAALHEEMLFFYTGRAAEEVELSEELARWGYRGAGGLIFAEAEEWRALSRLALRVLVEAAAAEQLGRQPELQRAARAVVVAEERAARGELRRDYVNQSNPHKARAVYEASLAGRRAVEKEEAEGWRDVAFERASDRLDLLVHSRGCDQEIGRRKLIEKRQRDGKRRLIAAYKTLFLQVHEELFRSAMEDLGEVQQVEVAARMHQEGRYLRHMAEYRAKFDAGRQHWRDVHKARVYDRIERDGRADELTRRHYMKLDGMKSRADDLHAQVGAAVDTSLARMHTTALEEQRGYGAHRQELAQMRLDEVRRRSGF